MPSQVFEVPCIVILVTGGAGFIGSRLCLRLRQRGDRVVVLDDYSTGTVESHVPGVTYHRGHTANIADLVPEVPEVIFHLGEFARVALSFERPEEVHRSNVVGTKAVLDYWRQQRCKMVYAGSSTRFACDDTDSPYAHTKRDNAKAVLSIAPVERLQHAIAYFYNVYGPGERAGITGTVIETFRQQWRAGQHLTLVVPGTQRRNFTHVDDIVSALLLIAEHGVGEFQVGAPETYSVRQVAMMFAPAVIDLLPPRRGDRFASSLDASRIRALGWQPRHRLAEYIADIVKAAA